MRLARAARFGRRLLCASACATLLSGAAPGAGSPSTPVRKLVPRVLAVHPHDPSAFTQGLLWHAGHLLESTGLYGRSTLREVDLATGRVRRRVDLPPDLFGEGLALRGGDLLQLTWQEERVLVWDSSRLQPRGEMRYSGEGWGLTSDGARLLMSDGSERISLRDARSFAETGRLRVVEDGRPVQALNELEWAEGLLWANVWMTDDIVGIDAATGQVVARVDCSSLLGAAEREAADVMNGIAYVPEKKVFLLTGKLWPSLFEVRFEPATTR